MLNKLGVLGKLYYQTDGVSGSAGWVESVNCRDLSLGLAAEEADNTTRAAGGFKSTRPTLIDLPISFGMVYDNTDANFIAFRNAFLGRNHIGIRAFDGTAADGSGVEADYVVTKFDRSEDLNGVMLVDVELKLTYVDTQAAWSTAS